MSRNKHIRQNDVEDIVNIIHTWDRDKLNWGDICDAAKPILGYLPSRSGLSAHADIQAAFSSRKKNLRQMPADKTPMPNSLASASRSLAARDNEIAALKQQVTDFRDKFDRWRYNAMLMKITIEKLDKPLPQVSRKE